MAYDIKKLGEKLAEQGIPVALEAAEALAGKVYVATKEWLKESAIESENKMDDLVMPFLDQLDPIVLPQIDKIDKQVG